jgi:hypothetical protein
MTETTKHPYAQVLQWVAEGKEIEVLYEGFWSKTGYSAVLSSALHGIYMGAVLLPQDFRLKPERHLHQDLIDAWKSGAIIQSQVFNEHWVDSFDNKPLWSEDIKYRIKPQPKPDIVGYLEIHGQVNSTDIFVGIITSDYWLGDNVKVVLCGETLKLKSVEII